MRALVRKWYVLLFVIYACRPQDELDLDWEPTQLLGTSLNDGVPASTTPRIRLRFNKPLDPASVRDNAIVVVPFLSGAACELDYVCSSKRCHRGTCQQSQVDAKWITDLVHPPLSSKRSKQHVRMNTSFDSSGTEVVLEPMMPLPALRLMDLLVSPTITDLTGNPVKIAEGSRLVLKREFSTADVSSGRPEVTLFSPKAQSANLPRNLKRAVVVFSEPVTGVDSSSLWLSSKTQQRIRSVVNVSSPFCGSTPDGGCYEIILQEQLPSLEVVQLNVSSQIVDYQGQEVLPPILQDFATGSDVDHKAPDLGPLEIEVADGCVVVRTKTEEVASLRIEGSWGAQEQGSFNNNGHEVSIHVPAIKLGVVNASIQDLAGNKTTSTAFPLDFHPIPRVVITEVLANPAGPEPSQELVELRNLSTETVNLMDWTLDDNDDGLGISKFPPQTLLPGQFAVVVGKGFQKIVGPDQLPDPKAVLIQLPSVLGASGLANAGEMLALRDAEGRLASAFGSHLSTRGSVNGRSYERIDASHCNVRTNWRLHPTGSSPGK